MASDSRADTSLIEHPVENPITAEWSLPLSYEDYKKLLKGSTPADMDSRWLCATDIPDVKGNTVVHIARSWTGHEYYSITVEAGNPDATEGENWGKFTSITWNSKELGYLGSPVTEKEAKEEAVGYCKGLMGCKLGGA